MSNTDLSKRPSALALMASRCNVDPAKLHSTLKNTVFKGATDDELLALVVTANTYELNPLLKEMHAFPQKGGGIVPIVGVDGWTKIVNRQENLDGIEFEFTDDGSQCTCTIHLKNRSHPIRVTEYLEECRRATEPWKMMPRRMLRHKALMQAARLAFGISGIHDPDEGTDIAMMRDVTPEAERPKTNPFAKREPEPVEAEEAKSDPVDDFQLEETPALTLAEIISHERTTGETNGKPWQLHRVKLLVDDEEIEATTFSNTIGTQCALNVSGAVQVELVDGKKGKEIKSINVIE